MNKLYSLLFVALLTCVSCAQKVIEATSPSEELNLKVISGSSDLKLKISKNNEPILTATVGKFIFSENDLRSNYTISSVIETSKNEVWYPVYGENNTVKNNYNEIVVSLKSIEQSNRNLDLVCRVYDEGIAFKYVFDNTEVAVLEKELTSFNFNADYNSWITEKAQGHYKQAKISVIKNAVERPLVIKKNETSYIAIGEAAMVDYARMKFSGNPVREFSIVSELASEVDLKKAGYESPWRFVMIGESPGELLENNFFVQNLNKPNEIEDTSWIKPGKVIREISLTTVGAKATIDFAERHNIEYVEFDAGWYGYEYDDVSDATTITVDPKRSPGPLDLLNVIKYAEEKGIGIILYVNRRALEKQLDEILPLFKSWGVKGVKYGFVNTGSQEWTSWLHDAIRKAAKYELMVDVHDFYRPTGYERTYPNLMTMEGIRGDEESPTTEHTLITLFTRMIAGAGDQTNCYLASRVTETMGGKAAQMAKAIMIYSPWNFIYWYDRPAKSPQKENPGVNDKTIVENSELKFYDVLPTVWDKTKVLEGEIGELATIARKSGSDWFIGSLTAKADRKLQLDLNFLDDNKKYEAVIFHQNEEDLKNNSVRQEKMDVNSQTVLKRDLVANSGVAVIIRKK